jgi:two-component system chemotaxis sensor kinase CheA
MAKDPYKYFRIEARELVEELSRDALALERTPGDGTIVARILRVAHTLKGAARVVRKTGTADLAHAIESILAPYRHGAPVDGAAVAEVIRNVDAVAADVRALGETASEPRRTEEVLDSVRVDVGELDGLLRSLYESGVQLAALRAHTDSLERAARVAGIASDQLATRAEGARARALVEELGASVTGVRRALGSGLDHVELELAQARETADRLRLLPASAVFDALERAVRDAAQSLGKNAQLRMTGGDTRLDAHVLSGVRGALLHIVRNAVAHGIESPSERASRGKPAVGGVELAVERRGGRVAFTCTDDGRGVDIEAVRTAAIRRGLSSPDAIAAMPRERVIELLLRGGTTTSPSVDAVSGRGIGLDVVRDSVAKLKGEISLETEPHRGTRVEIRVPISLTSMTALVVGCGDTVASIPLDAVRATVRVSRDDLASTPEGDSLVFDGEIMPFVLLSALLAARGREERLLRYTTLIVHAANELAAIGVDRIFGTATVIVRRLPDVTRAEPIVAGASLNGEGAPQLVLDAAGIIAAAKGLRAAPRTMPSRPLPVLVIDDSLTTRMLEQSILESAGYDVELATSAEEGLEKARAGKYSVFLVDVEMPGMNGFEFVARTREDPVLRNVPAILVTSRAAPEDRRRGMDAGAQAYVVKSEFDQGKLLDVIRELVA